MNEREYRAAEREMDIYREQVEECEDRLDDALQRIANLELQNVVLLKALRKIEILGRSASHKGAMAGDIAREALARVEGD